MIQNKIIILLLIIFLLAFFVYKTSSFYSNSIKGENLIFKVSEWTPGESALEIFKDNVVYSIDEDIIDQNPSKFLQNLVIDKNKYLSFQYKIESEEDADGFDEPNFVLLINQEIVYQDYAEIGAWTKVFINLNNYKSNDNKYVIDFRTNNTFDEKHLPALFVKEISTSQYLAKKNDLLKFSSSKKNSEIHLKYSVEENETIAQKHIILFEPYEFAISEHFFNDEIEFYSVDSFGNVEASNYAKIFTDFSAPNTIDDLVCFNESDQELNTNFTVPFDDYLNSQILYDASISKNELSEKIRPYNFKKFGFSNLASKSGTNENLLFKNLNSELNVFSIKSIDQAGNSSEISSCFR